MEALVENCRYRIQRLIRLRRLEWRETEFSLDERKAAWHDLLHGLPLQLTIIEREKTDEGVVDTVVKGREALVYLQSIQREEGHINIQTLEYNEEGQGLPLRLLHETRKYMEWTREISEGDLDHPDLVSAEQIRGFVFDVQAPTALVCKT